MGINDGLVGYWQFDERDGSTVLDRSGNNNHGLLINGTRSDGKYGKAVELSGSDDSHISIPGSLSLNSLTDQITVTAWVFPSVAPSGFKVIVSRQIGTVLHPDQFYLGFGPENGRMHYKWHLGTDDNGTLREGDIYSGIPDVNRWIHMAGTYDGSMMRLYVDGVEIDNQPLTGSIRVDDNPVTIGGEENGAEPQVVDGEFEGLIDEVRIYNRALDASEIREVYNLDSDE
ncbi:MAG: LamG domain-containing protein [Scytonema sp. PMC 1069.18]|nr:LamG domain-containing protein [Scytonema sp. PMC 1069.18]MEC4887128.1 LamG domain-containing protein [Scytonema sp. PMC 1070.18]